jgi:hypothetical protein
VLVIALTMNPKPAPVAQPPSQTATPSTAPSDRALAAARNAALSAQAEVNEAWTRLPAGADEFAAEIEDATALMEAGNAAFAEAEAGDDADAYRRATDGYAQARVQFTAITQAVEQAMDAEVTAEELTPIRAAAFDARARAQGVGVADTALAAADAFFSQAEDSESSGNFAVAAAKYDDAKRLYAQAADTAIAAMTSRAQAAQRAAGAARDEAVGKQATAEELATGDDAFERGGAAFAAGDFGPARDAYAAAEQAFSTAGDLAVGRMKQAELRSLRAGAEMARQSAESAQANETEMRGGRDAFAAATNAEANGNLDEAAAKFNAARDQFRTAATKATARANAMKQDLTAQLASAKGAAQTARSALSEDEKKLVAKEAQAADNTWAKAEAAETANDLATAINDYRSAQELYTKASQSAQNTIKAARDRMVDSKRRAETAKNKINAAAREAAPTAVNEGDAFWAEAVKSEDAGSIDVARQQYDNARSSFDSAVQAADQRAQQMATQARQAEADAQAAKAKEAEEKARQDMASAKTRAGAARTAAGADSVSEFAGAELAAAAKNFTDAEALEARRDYPRAAALFATAETQYKNAVTLAAERQQAQQQSAQNQAMAQARADMDAARADALTAQRGATTEQTKQLAASELGQADRQWNEAENAAKAGDLSRATQLYGAATTAYGSAQAKASEAQATEQEKAGSSAGPVPLHLRRRGTGR